MGGLGNQLFQIFAVISYAINNKQKIVFPYSDVLTTGIVRNTYWNHFLSSMKMFTTINPNNNITNETLLEFSRYIEPQFSFTPIPQFDVNDILLDGYFQSYKYFEMDKSTILSLIRVRKQKASIVDEFSEYIVTHLHTVSMHFRFGDYKDIPDCYPLLTLEYYRNALEYICKTRDISMLKVLYFCQEEDNEVVSRIIHDLTLLYPNILFTKVDDTISDWKQLLVMSSCNDNIIANSTFSWWGGYFNEYPSKIVCYPSRWFGPKLQHDVSDLFPTDWTRIVMNE
jgi:hypothetical protein